MSLRPTHTAWFEILIQRDDLAVTLPCLASGGDVELESHSEGSATHLLPRLRAALDEYQRLTQRYASFWPTTASLATAPHREPEAISAAALERLRAWAADADPLITQLQKLQHERSELTDLVRLLSGARTRLPDFDLLYGAGPVLAGRIFLLESQTAPFPVPDSVLALRIDRAERGYVLAVGPREQMETLDEGLVALKARRLEVPPSATAANGEDALAQLEARLAEIARLIHQLHAQLSACDVEHTLASALADMAFIGWLANHIPEFAGTDQFVRISGWTRDLSGRRLDASLRRSGIHYLLHFPNPPPDLTPPVVLRNPRWAQPFEFFTRLLGTPAANEADPSELLALLAPLMFGFMFGDVGQGAVLVLAGLALRKRRTVAQLLVSGGAAAIVFGALFGSVFTREDILPALWLHPLQKPLSLLAVSLAGGSLIMLIGLALDGLESHWVGQGSRWWATRAGLALSYLGAIAIAIDRRAAWAIPAGVAWYCVGEVARAEHRAQRLGASLGVALQTLLQLLLNTLSFARVGAFALAHAGLAAAISALCAGIGSRPVALLALALGNALLILVEGLAVSIQTTRLVLFEFFIRFLRGDGRAFRPLQALPTTVSIDLSRKSS